MTDDEWGLQETTLNEYVSRLPPSEIAKVNDGVAALLEFARDNADELTVDADGITVDDGGGGGVAKYRRGEMYSLDSGEDGNDTDLDTVDFQSGRAYSLDPEGGLAEDADPDGKKANAEGSADGDSAEIDNSAFGE